MMITRVTSGVTNVNRLFTKGIKNWKIKIFNYIIVIINMQVNYLQKKRIYNQIHNYKYD